MWYTICEKCNEREKIHRMVDFHYRWMYKPGSLGKEQVMWEDVFQVYRNYGQGERRLSELLASDLSLSNATIFMSAWMSANDNDRVSSLEIRRQQREYDTKCGADDE